MKRPANGRWALLCLLLAATATLAGPRVAARKNEAADTWLRVPGFTAYVHPDPGALMVSEPGGVSGWRDKRQKIVWYGDLKNTGLLRIAVALRLPAGQTVRLRLSVAEKSRVVSTTGMGTGEAAIPFGDVPVAAPGYQKFTLEGLDRTGETFGDVAALLVTGPASNGAQFNRKERRNAASVHLGYPPAPNAPPVAAFYNEVTVRTDPVWSYYMACGFRRGYFGIQVNGPAERRIIFSVWDSGNEAVDRAKVAADDRVQLVAKGENVVASDFGNEGTGGHSHRVYPWKTGQTYRFLVTARAEAGHTVYSGWFFFPETKCWGLIASFRAPKDGGSLSGLYSFNENFGGANGDLRRQAEFGNQWIRTTGGTWRELTTARFTHDPTGKTDRTDYDAGLTKNGRFYLSNGGFVRAARTVRYGDSFTRPATNKPPAVNVDALKN